jgi:hypothetical protein
MTPRAAAVKAGRRSAQASNDTAARPCLDGREHGVIVARSDDRQQPETHLPFNGCYELRSPGWLLMTQRRG